MADARQDERVEAAADSLAVREHLPLVYDELRRLAAQRLANERPGHTLDATALVHEVYLRLLARGRNSTAFANRAHFFAAAAEAMRRILIESARRKKRARRGGGRRRVNLSGNEPACNGPDANVLAIDEALERLASEDSLAAQLVRLRYYAGLSVEESGEALGLSRAEAYRQWTYARAWLRAALDDAPPEIATIS